MTVSVHPPGKRREVLNMVFDLEGFDLCRNLLKG